MVKAAQEGIERAEMLDLVKGSVHQCDPSMLPAWADVNPDDYPRSDWQRGGVEGDGVAS